MISSLSLVCAKSQPEMFLNGISTNAAAPTRTATGFRDTTRFITVRAKAMFPRRAAVSTGWPNESSDKQFKAVKREQTSQAVSRPAVEIERRIVKRIDKGHL